MTDLPSLFVGQASASNPVSPPDSLKKLNEEVYRQNAELIMRNKILTILRHLLTQSLQYLDVTEASQSVVNVLSEELGLIFALMSLYDKKTSTIRHKAITQNSLVRKSLGLLHEPLGIQMIDEVNKENLIAKAFHEQKEQRGKNLFDIWGPLMNKEECLVVETFLQIKEYYILPVISNGIAIGTLTLCLSKPFSALSSAERESINQITLLVGFALDRAKLHEETLRNNNKLKELDKLKDEFLSVASHELRTPMIAMKGYLWLMLKHVDILPPDMAEKLRRIYNSSERMIALVNGMLDLSRIENGKIELVLETFDVVEIVNDVEQEFLGQAADRKITLTMDKDIHYQVNADRNKVHEVVVNFISNAIKYNVEGGSIHISFIDKGPLVAISVADTGIGIDKADMSKLFRKFSRIETLENTLSKISGTGLGLFISKNFVELMGGTIIIDSTPGKGSTFTFTLPKSQLK